MNPPEDELATFLHGVRETREPTDDDTRRVRAALQQRLPPGALSQVGPRRVSSVGPGRSAHRTARAAGLLGVLAPLGAAAKLGTAKLVVGALLATGAGTGVTWWVLEHEAPTSAPLRHSPPAPAAPSADERQVVSAPRKVSAAPGPGASNASADQPPQASPPAVGHPPAEPIRASAQQDSLRDEVLLLRQAESARKNGNPAGCLSLLSEMSRRFPRSVLTEERLALTVLAHCDLGQSGAAAAAAERLQRDYPKTVHTKRLRSSCVNSTARFEDQR